MRPDAGCGRAEAARAGRDHRPLPVTVHGQADSDQAGRCEQKQTPYPNLIRPEAHEDQFCDVGAGLVPVPLIAAAAYSCGKWSSAR